MKTVFNWKEEQGEAWCSLYYKNQVFIGIAFCHSNDKDMQNKLTGQEIAYHRALIKYYQYQKNVIITPKLKAYTELYNLMKQNSEFNEHSHESKILRKQIKLTQLDLEAVKELIENERKYIKDYIDAKDKIYEKLRAHRNGQNK